LAQQGDFEAADRVFAAELEKHPGDFALLFNRALVNYRAGWNEKALAILESVAATDRGQAAYQSLLGSVLTRLGQYRKALAPSQEAIRLEPSNPEHRLRLAGLYLRLKMGQHATDVYRQGQSLFPERPEFWLGLGVVEQMQAKFPAALEIFQQVTQKFPQQEGGFLFLAHAQIKAGQPTEALETARKLLALKPGSALGEYLCAEAAWAIPGQEGEARRHVQKSLQANPRLPEALVLAAKIELKLGDPREAIGYLEQAISFEPRMASAHYVLSQAYRRMGDTARAEAAADSFRKLRVSEDAETELLGNFLTR
jgi:tetratricopeptide (TPR) repeat protein